MSATTRRMATLLAVLVFPALGIADTNAAASVSGYEWNDGGTTDLISSNLPNSKLMKLNLTAPLEDVTVELIVAGASGIGTKKTTMQRIQKINAKQTEYRGGSYPHGVPIVAISDPNTKKTYVFSRGHTIFFISDKSGMIGCAYDGPSFVLLKSYVEIPTASGGEEAAIARFAAQFDDVKLAQANKNPNRVFLAHAAPPAFFSAGSAGGSAPGKPTIKAFDLSDSILRLDLVSEGGKVTCSFWIDLKEKKTIKSVVDGVEMDLSTGTPFPVPLRKQ